MSGPESRKDQRVPLAAKVQIKTEGLEKFIEKYSGNISKGGIFIKTPQPLPIGKEVVITVVVPGGTQLIEARGTVTWTRPANDPHSGEPAGMGIQFTAVDDGSQKIIDAIVKAGAPAQPPPAAATPAKGSAAASARTKSQIVMGASAPPGKEEPKGPSVDMSGLESLMDDIDEVLSDKPPSAAAASTPDTLTRAMPGKAPVPQAKAPTPPPPAAKAPPPAPPPVPHPAHREAGTTQLPPSEVVLGIDLGTTYSCAAFMRDGVPDIVPMDAGYRTLPSVVTITANDQVVGRAAYDRIATHPKNTVYGSKRLLGRRFISKAVQDARKYFDYEIVSDENGNAAVRIDGEIYPLVMVTARILEEIRNWARGHFKSDVNQALICVPAYYNDNQRNAVIEAGRLAGFDVKRIVNEPVAAALAYGFDRGLQQRLLVYDLGGGTFDVSIMELNGNVFDVVAAGGDPYLGGVDFDNRIVDWLVAEFKRTSGVDVSGDKVAILRLRAAAESAKRDLSEKAEVRVQLPYLARTNAGVASLDLTLRRPLLEQIVKELVDRTVTICAEVIAAAGLERTAIDAVLLVGGQTRMPMVQSALTTYFGKPPRKGVHPDEAVAMGAALLASSLERVDSVVLLDVVSMSIGVGLPGGVYKPVLLRNTKLPATAATAFSTTKDGQTSMSVDIFQGDNSELAANDYLGTIELEGFPARPAGQIVFEIAFRMDAQGFLVVIATERSSGITQQMTLRTRESPEALHAAVGR